MNHWQEWIYWMIKRDNPEAASMFIWWLHYHGLIEWSDHSDVPF